MSWTHLSDETPTARKPHKCYLCARPIEPGEKHVKRTGTDGGQFSCVRMHEKCEAFTHGWDEDEWECHDPHDFRTYELQEESSS